MAKVGLKETLTLLAAGYKKKDIDALAAIDEDIQQEEPDQPAQEDKKATVPNADQEQQQEQEPNYKALYEDLLKKQEEKDSEIKEKDEKIKKIQKDNVNSNSLPDVEKERAASQASLIDAIKSFY